jgi:hypothetical protein
MGQRALSLGEETDHAEIQGWAHEIRAWMNLTGGDYHGVIAAARSGPTQPRTTAWRCSSPPGKPKPGHGSETGA